MRQGGRAQATTPHETRRASCNLCEWESSAMNAGHTARQHVEANPRHQVVLIKTVTQTFHVTRAGEPHRTAARTLSDVPGF